MLVLLKVKNRPVATSAASAAAYLAFLVAIACRAASAAGSRSALFLSLRSSFVALPGTNIAVSDEG